MFERVVTISASTPARLQLARTASWRRLSAALGACDMDRRQQLFERGEGGNGPGTLLLGDAIDDSDGRVVDGLDCGDLERRCDSWFALGRRHLARQFRDDLFEVGIVPGEGQCRL